MQAIITFTSSLLTVHVHSLLLGDRTGIRSVKYPAVHQSSKVLSWRPGVLALTWRNLIKIGLLNNKKLS